MALVRVGLLHDYVFTLRADRHHEVSARNRLRRTHVYVVHGCHPLHVDAVGLGLVDDLTQVVDEVLHLGDGSG